MEAGKEPEAAAEKDAGAEAAKEAGAAAKEAGAAAKEAGAEVGAHDEWAGDKARERSAGLAKDEDSDLSEISETEIMHMAPKDENLRNVFIVRNRIGRMQAPIKTLNA